MLLVGGLLLTLAGAFCVLRLLAWRQRALDEGGVELLRAGYDPVAPAHPTDGPPGGTP